MDFPAFSEYQDVFSLPLPTSTFANYSPPSWIPTLPALLRIARVIYPYWKERQIERDGHRIIPTLNVSVMYYCHPNDCRFFRETSPSTNHTSVSADERVNPFGKQEPHRLHRRTNWLAYKSNSITLSRLQRQYCRGRLSRGRWFSRRRWYGRSD